MRGCPAELHSAAVAAVLGRASCHFQIGSRIFGVREIGPQGRGALIRISSEPRSVDEEPPHSAFWLGNFLIGEGRASRPRSERAHPVTRHDIFTKMVFL